MRSERFPLNVLDAVCTSCGSPVEEGHGPDCLLAEHEAMLAGDKDALDSHDQDECYWCAAAQAPALSECRCGKCCQRLLIEVNLEDARREPKIAEQGSAIFSRFERIPGKRELEGFFLNSRENDWACTFLDRATNLCQIYDSRPLVCRLFNCDAPDNPARE